jgi:hypothetical protein
LESRHSLVAVLHTDSYPAGFGSTLRMSLDRRVLDVVSPERTFTGIGAHSLHPSGAVVVQKCWAPRGDRGAPEGNPFAANPTAGDGEMRGMQGIATCCESVSC